MTWRVVRQPEQLFGLGGLPTWLIDHGVRTVSCWMDPHTPASERVSDLLRRRNIELDFVPLPPDGTPAMDRLDLVLSRPRPDAVLAVGGGAVMDWAALHAACLTSPHTRNRLAASERCGWIPLPPSNMPRVPVIAVPTTIGTGSEVSRFACFDTLEGKRLVQGDAVQPTLAVSDPITTRGLSARQVLDAVIEILARVVGPAIGTTTSNPVQDRATEAITARLIVIGNLIAAEDAAPGDAIRDELSRLSVLAHAPWLNDGRDPFSNRAWFLITELSGATRCGKAPAAAAVLPALCELAEQNAVWADPRRIALWWSATRSAMPDLPTDPAIGLRALFARWGSGGPITTNEPAEVLSRRTHRRWGGGLPMLAGLTRTDLTAFFRCCLDPARQPDIVPTASAAGG